MNKMKITFSDELSKLHAQPVEIVDTCDDIAEIESEMSLYEYFTARNCMQLSIGFAKLYPDGEIVSIFNVVGTQKMLIHSGFLMNGQVFDIEGAHELTKWSERWARGMQVEVEIYAAHVWKKLELYVVPGSDDFGDITAAQLVSLTDFDSIVHSIGKSSISHEGRAR